MANACSQSTTSDWPPEGLSPIEAIVRIVGAEWWQAYMSARDTCRGIRPVVAGGRNRSSDEWARLERRAAAYEAAFGPVLDAWEHGELELWAWRGDPTVPPELIQAVARPYMRWQLDRGSFRIEGVLFRNALFRLSWGVRPAAASMRKTKANSRANWLHDAVERRVAAGDAPRGITELSRQLAEEMKTSGLHAYKARTIENRLRDWELWPVRVKP